MKSYLEHAGLDVLSMSVTRNAIILYFVYAVSTEIVGK